MLDQQNYRIGLSRQVQLSTVGAGENELQSPPVRTDTPEFSRQIAIEASGQAATARASGSTLGNLIRLPRRLLEAGKYRFTCYIFSHLWLLKLLFGFLRVVRPIMIFGKIAVVTKARDIREVLERFDDFVLGGVIEPGMPWGPFLMTVDWREQHKCERQMLESVVRPATDLDTIRAIAADVCRSRIESLAKTGQIDVVADLAEPAMVRIFADYIGVPPLGGSGRRMARAMRDLAGIIMVNPPMESQAWRDSRDDMVCVTRQLLDQLAAEQAAAGDTPGISPQTLFSRLIQRHGASDRPAWFNEDWIRCYLTGLVATGGATVIRGTAHAVDQLLERGNALQGAQQLTYLLDQAEQNAPAAPSPQANGDTEAGKLRDALRLCIYEALRFRPMLPLLVRDCPRQTIIAKGTPRARLVPAGTRVIAPPLAAMFDSEAFPNPSAFNERPIESYFHFGFGPRRCFGKYIADIVMLEIVRALARLPDLARAPGSAGQVSYEGPAPCSLTVTFTARNAGAAR